MSTSQDPQREHPHTYFVQDRANMEELKRLQIQDQMLTTSMGGVLAEARDNVQHAAVGPVDSVDHQCRGWSAAAASGSRQAGGEERQHR